MSIEFEKELKNILENKGNFVLRSCGSRGPIDLIKIDREGETEVMQLKQTKKTMFNISSEEMKNLKGILENYKIKTSIFVKFPSCILRCPLEKIIEKEILQISENQEECEKFDDKNE